MKKAALIGFMALSIVGFTQAQVTVFSQRDADGTSSSESRTQEYIFSSQSARDAYINSGTEPSTGSTDPRNFSLLDATNSSNTYQLSNSWQAAAANTSVVGELQILTGGSLSQSAKGTKTFSMETDTLLNGGSILGNTNSKAGNEAIGARVDFGDNDFTIGLLGGTLSADLATRSLLLRNGNITGSGTINVTGLGTVQFESGITTTDFTGSFNVTGGTFDLNSTATNGSFEMSLSSDGVYDMGTSIVLSSLTIDGDVIAAGTYSYGDFTGTQQDNLLSGAGTITVVPEPGSYALLAGCLGLTWVMLRRRR